MGLRCWAHFKPNGPRSSFYWARGSIILFLAPSLSSELSCLSRRRKERGDADLLLSEFDRWGCWRTTRCPPTSRGVTNGFPLIIQAEKALWKSAELNPDFNRRACSTRSTGRPPWTPPSQWAWLIGASRVSRPLHARVAGVPSPLPPRPARAPSRGEGPRLPGDRPHTPRQEGHPQHAPPRGRSLIL